LQKYLVDNKDLIIAMIKDNDKETLQDEIYAGNSAAVLQEEQKVREDRMEV